MAERPATKDLATTTFAAQVAPSGSLRRSMSQVLLGNAVYAGCQLAMMIAVVQFCTPAMVGQFALGLAINAPIMMLAALQLRMLLSTDQTREYRFRDYLLLRALMSAAGIAAVAGVSAIAGYEGHAILVILAVSLAKAIELLGDIFHGLFQKHDHMSRICVSLVSKGALSLAALTLVVATTGNITLGALAMSAATLFVLLVYDLPNAWTLLGRLRREHRAPLTRRRNGKDFLNLPVLGKLLVLGVPLGLAVALNSLNLNIPRFLLESTHGERELGIFAALAAFMRLGFHFETALGRSALPRLARLHAQGQMLPFKRMFWKLLSAVTVVGTMGVLVSLFLGKLLLAAIYTAEYAEHAVALHGLMLAAGIGYIAGVLKVAVDATRTFVAQLPLFLAAAATTTVASIYMVPTWGIAGAAAALIVAKLVLGVGYGAILLYVVTKNTRGLAAGVHP